MEVVAFRGARAILASLAIAAGVTTGDGALLAYHTETARSGQQTRMQIPVNSPGQVHSKKLVDRTNKADRLNIMIIQKVPARPTPAWEYQRDVGPAEEAVCQAVASPIVDPALGGIVGRCLV